MVGFVAYCLILLFWFNGNIVLNDGVVLEAQLVGFGLNEVERLMRFCVFAVLRICELRPWSCISEHILYS